MPHSFKVGIEVDEASINGMLLLNMFPDWISKEVCQGLPAQL